MRSINRDGTLKISNVGGPIYSTVNGEYCNIYTRDNKVYRGTILHNACAAHVHKKSDDKVELDNLIVRLDEVVSSKDEVLSLGIDNGDFVCYDPKVELVNGFIKSRFLDDKAGIAIMYQFAKDVRKVDSNKNVLLFFSVYEEVGHGGTSLPMDVDEAISIDMGCIGDDLSGSEFKVSICAKDSSGPYDYDLTTKLVELAKGNDIDYALDIYPMYSSDATAMQRAGNDIKAALIGPGVHSSHGMERTHVDALNNTLSLLLNYIKN